MVQTNSVETLNILNSHRKYFETGITKSVDFRIQQLLRLKKMIKDNENLIIEALSMDLHKPKFEAFSAEIGVVYMSITNALKNIKNWSKPQKVKTPFTLLGHSSFIYPEPYGTVLIIGPFNFPFYLVLEPLVGAISAGNCAVVKPSELTPQVSGIIARLVKEYFAEDYIRVIQGEKEITSALINAPFDYIFFTGSVGVGKIVMEAAARNLVPVTLELGGKSPCIIDETADIDRAAKKIAWGKFSNAGQACIAPDYVVIHNQVKNQLIDSLKKYVQSFYGTNPKESADFARVINTRHTERLINLIDKNKVIFGGDFDIQSRYIAPTILDGVGWDDPIMKDEIFGPILPIMEFTDLDQVIKSIRTRPKPLALYIFTTNKATEKNIIDQISYGGGCVNDVNIHLANSNLPFGGVGASGMGHYHVKSGFETFSHKKSVLKRRSNFNVAIIYPPYNEGHLNLVKRFLK